ncbi:DUF930 domain-containing protein [Hoeflea sp. CAU 1731]
MEVTNEIPDAPVIGAARSRWFYGAVAISLLVHVVLAIVVLQLIHREHDPEIEAVMVDLVPPPQAEAEEPELELPEDFTAEAPPQEPAPPPVEEVDEEQEMAQSAQSMPVLKPVTEFGETDSGPLINRDGIAKQRQGDPEADTGAAETDGPAETQTAASETSEDAVDSPKEQAMDLPELSEPVAEPELAADTGDAVERIIAEEQKLALVAPEAETAPQTSTASGGAAGTPDDLPHAEELYSDTMLESPRVRTAMNGMPRSERANLLCVTEMRGQLMASSPPYPPEMLPSFDLPFGTVLAPDKAAFRSQGQWYDFAFRCEVDEDVTKVVNFSYRVGAPIPRDQWSARGFPSF